MAHSKDEILAGLAEIINEETSLPAETIELRKVTTGRPRHRLAFDAHHHDRR